MSKTTINDKTFQIRDKRKAGWFYTDNDFLNGYAKVVGWPGQVVYYALCRHERDGKAYPGMIHMSTELGISLGSVSKGVHALTEWNLIEIEIVSSGKYVYYLKDKTEWKKIPKKSWSNQKNNL